MMQIPIASDHAGFQAKQTVITLLEKLNYQPVDLGTTSDDSVDYPDFAIKVAKRVNSGDNKMGILICGSGQGVCMTANKYSNVRAALVYDEDSAEMSRRHNNANILCLAGRKLTDEELEQFVERWLGTDFDGGRHERRTNKIKSLTNDS